VRGAETGVMEARFVLFGPDVYQAFEAAVAGLEE
jgi:hypothetical protein